MSQATCSAWAARAVWVLVLCGARSAAAADPPASDHGPRSASGAEIVSIVPFPLRVEPALLVVMAADEGVAPGVALTGFALLGPIELGVSATGETQLLGYTRGGVSAHAGARARLARFEVDLAGTLGTAYTRKNGPLLSDDPGAGGATAFVGGRLGLTQMFFVSKRQQVRLGAGLIASYEQDLDPRTIRYGYTVNDDWFGNNSYETRGEKRIGTQRGVLRVVFILGLD